MLKKTKLLLVSAFAVLAFTAVTGSAFAASFEIRPAGNISLTSLGKLTFGSGSTTIACSLTFNGTLSSGPIAKTAGTQIGSITSVEIENETCEGATITEMSLTLPWAITYQSISGTLPSAVASISLGLSNLSFKISGFASLECLYGGTLNNNEMSVTGTNPYTSGLMGFDPTAISKREGSIFCPASVGFRGTLALSPTQTITRL